MGYRELNPLVQFKYYHKVHLEKKLRDYLGNREDHLVLVPFSQVHNTIL